MLFNNHTHTEYSNIRLLDCINKPKDLISKAIELGLAGIAITDHECLSSHVIVNKYIEEIRKTNPNFKVGLGNEIYLVDKRGPKQKYYHFLLIAKDSYGYQGLQELSSTAWYNSYSDRGMERVPLTKEELYNIGIKYKGHIIATTACRGGELSTLAFEKYQLERKEEDSSNIACQMLEFANFCKEIFGEDFYIECAPSTDKEQIEINQTLLRFGKAVNIPLTVGSDAHYLTKKERPIHKAYLNAKEGEREVDSFYEFAYLMDEKETEELLSYSFSKEDINEIFNNSMTIYNKIEFFSLFKKQAIKEIKVKDYPKKEIENYPILNQLSQSNNAQERYWVNECIKTLKEKNKYNDEYLKRLEEEADTKKVIGEKLETCMFAYPNTLQHYIDLFWECGSIVGAGRGSSCSGLNHYLLGITQVDPIEWNLPWFRYMNKERVEIGDIDLDLSPSKRPLIIQKIKEERSELISEDCPNWAKNNLGCTLIATFGTEKTKSAILSACRGYRSEEYPEGIDVDEAQYLSSLVPSERGFLWEIKDVVNGNSEKNRKPVYPFLNQIKRYPGLLEIIESIEGLVNKRSSHASGVVFFDKNPFQDCAFMKTPKGEIITQFDLHDLEFVGQTKYDFLVTEVQDKIAETIRLLQEDNIINANLSLKEAYDKYLHPEVLPLEDENIWDALEKGSVLNTFQFDSLEGAKTAKAIKPRNILEMSDANGLMRLMGEEEERPIDKYVRYKKNIQLWYKEMDNAGLTKEEQKTLEPYFLQSYGVPPSQEQLMLMLMDKDICGFSLGEANNARKVVGKKQMDKIPVLHQQVLDRAKSSALGAYVWKYGAGPQMGYAFSNIHALVYSFIGVQTLFLGTHFNPIYWNTACLIVNSASLEDNSESEIVDIYAPEAQDLSEGVTFEDLPDRSAKIRKTNSTDYGKIAKAISDIKASGIKVSLTDINKSRLGFSPDVKNNQILYGLKGLINVGDDLIENIIKNRPYISPRDYLNKVKTNKQAMVSLIKSGAFDEMMDRKLCMAWYLWEVCDKKSRLTLQNIPGLIKYNMLPENNEEQIMARRIYEFNRYLKAICKFNNVYYRLDERAINFLTEIGCEDYINTANGDNFYLEIKQWDKRIYQPWMDVFRNWITSDKENLLQKLNEQIFKEDWDKYAKGNLASWEMEVMCFYYSEHELKNVNNGKYGIMDFYKLPEEPVIDRTFTKGNKEIKLYKLCKICGTCIAKNKTKGIATLLTTTGVVNVKFNKEYFAMFDKQISEKQSDGTKKVKEKSWFNRGSMIAVNGMRSGDNFIAKKYASDAGHTLYKITSIDSHGDLTLQTERYKGGIEEDV